MYIGVVLEGVLTSSALCSLEQKLTKMTLCKVLTQPMVYKGLDSKNNVNRGVKQTTFVQRGNESGTSSY